LEFDHPLMRHHGVEVDDAKGYDLMKEVMDAAGAKAWAGYNLDALAKANGIEGKFGDGAMAPIWWQQGKRGQVIDYCLQDVTITVKIIRLVIDRGWLFDPKTNGVIRPRKPQDVIPTQEALFGGDLN